MKTLLAMISVLVMLTACTTDVSFNYVSLWCEASADSVTITTEPNLGTFTVPASANVRNIGFIIKDSIIFYVRDIWINKNRFFCDDDASPFVLIVDETGYYFKRVPYHLSLRRFN